MGKLKIIPLSESGVDVHIHTDSSGNYISGANLKKHGDDKNFIRLDNYQAAMGDYYAEKLNLKIKER